MTLNSYQLGLIREAGREQYSRDFARQCRRYAETKDPADSPFRGAQPQPIGFENAYLHAIGAGGLGSGFKSTPPHTMSSAPGSAPAGYLGASDRLEGSGWVPSAAIHTMGDDADQAGVPDLEEEAVREAMISQLQRYIGSALNMKNLSTDTIHRMLTVLQNDTQALKAKDQAAAQDAAFVGANGVTDGVPRPAPIQMSERRRNALLAGSNLGASILRQRTGNPHIRSFAEADYGMDTSAGKSIDVAREARKAVDDLRERGCSVGKIIASKPDMLRQIRQALDAAGVQPGIFRGPMTDLPAAMPQVQFLAVRGLTLVGPLRRNVALLDRLAQIVYGGGIPAGGTAASAMFSAGDLNVSRFSERPRPGGMSADRKRELLEASQLGRQMLQGR